jgi:GNAT superfamily N-acetyltransferase
VIALRQLAPGDEAEAFDLARRFHAESVYRDHPLALAKVDALIRQAMADDDRWCCVAVSEGFLVGYLMAVIHEHYFGYTRTCSDLGFYILPEHRSLWTARAMLERLEHWAFHVKRAEEINLGISSGIADAAIERFYRRCGYARGFSGMIKAR